MPIIYRAKRVGQYGRIFSLFKIRTMVINASEIGGSSTSEDDPRITGIGKILRRYKLDELPQLANLLRGDVKFIGWRPESPEYFDTIPREVIETKPGIIGLATLWDIDEGAILKGKENPDEYYKDYILPKKRELELYYVRNKNWKLDLKIILWTLLKLLKMPVKPFWE